MSHAPGEDFDEFVRSRSAPLFRAAYAMTGDSHLAEDLVQETMAKVYVRWRTIHTSPDAYARKVLMRSVSDRWRLRRRRPESPLLPGVERPVQDGSETLALRDELVRALRELPHRQRAVVVLRFLADLPEADIAATLGCSVGTVKSQLSRGLVRLRGVLVPPSAPPVAPGGEAATGLPTGRPSTASSGQDQGGPTAQRGSSPSGPPGSDTTTPPPALGAPRSGGTDRGRR